MTTLPDSTLYPIAFVRVFIEELYGVTHHTWYYHQGKCPAPDIQLAGYDWYSVEQLGLVREYFATALKRGGKKAKTKTVKA